MFKRLLIAAILIALFLGGVAYFQLVFKPAMIADFIGKMAPPAATVTAEPAKTETWVARVHSIGTMVAIEGVEVAPQLGGTVMEYFFDSGQDVKQGEKLVQIDISVEEADLVSAKATLLEAELDRERKQSLVKKEAVSQAILDAAIAKRDSAAASVERIEALIAQKTITAPFTGTLGLRRVEKGQYVSPGQALVWLQALDPIWVDFPVPESEVSKFKIGSKIELTVDTYPGEVFKGEVSALDARLSQDARTLMVRGTLPNADHKLLPGMFANTAVLAGEPRELVTVPRTALTYSLYGDSVWVVKEGSAEKSAPATAATEQSGAAIAADAPEEGPKQLTAERRFVRVGQVEEGRIAILDGIEAGEQVITSGQLKLQPGAAIKVNNADALKPPAVLPKQ
jgi:membrane fusion protein (multidrug efflux system)